MAGKNLKKKEEEVKVTTEVLEEKKNVEEGVTESPETQEDKSEPDVQVDTSSVDTSNIPEEKNVRVKANSDVSFMFGGERYSFKEGVATVVPKAVKLHMNRIGVLAPM